MPVRYWVPSIRVRSITCVSLLCGVPLLKADELPLSLKVGYPPLQPLNLFFGLRVIIKKRAKLEKLAMDAL